jgi:hypothetical protein
VEVRAAHGVLAVVVPRGGRSGEPQTAFSNAIFTLAKNLHASLLARHHGAVIAISHA